jgi:hypothetical protein
MAFFTKVSTGTQMTDCDFFEYINSPKGFCCEKGWLWEYIGMQKTGREWKQWFEDTEFSCNSFFLELLNDRTPIFADQDAFYSYFESIGYIPLSYEASGETEVLYIYGSTFMRDEFLKGNNNILSFNSDTPNDNNLHGVSNSFFQGCSFLESVRVGPLFRHFGDTQNEETVFDGCSTLRDIYCNIFFNTSRNGTIEGDLRYSVDSFATTINYI